MRFLFCAVTAICVLCFQATPLTAQTPPNTAVQSDSCQEIAAGSEINNLSTRLQGLQSSTVGIWVRFYIVLADKEKPQDRIRVTYTPSFSGWGQVIKSGGRKYVLTLNHLVNLQLKPDSAYMKSIKENELYKRFAEKAKVTNKGFDVLLSAEPDLLESQYRTEVVRFGKEFEIKYNDSKNSDGFALLQLPRQLSYMQPVEIGSSRCVGLGAKLWEVGSEKPDGFISGIDAHEHSVSNIGNQHAFQLSDPTLPGASGSGIFAFYGGGFKLVGLTMASEERITKLDSTTAHPSRGIIARIEAAEEFLK